MTTVVASTWPMSPYGVIQPFPGGLEWADPAGGAWRGCNSHVFPRPRRSAPSRGLWISALRVLALARVSYSIRQDLRTPPGCGNPAPSGDVDDCSTDR